MIDLQYSRTLIIRHSVNFKVRLRLKIYRENLIFQFYKRSLFSVNLTLRVKSFYSSLAMKCHVSNSHHKEVIDNGVFFI